MMRSAQPARPVGLEGLEARRLLSGALAPLVVQPLNVRSVVCGKERGFPPEVQVSDPATGQVIQDYNAFSAGFLGGIRVALGDINGDGTPDVIVGAGPGAGPHVKVFSGTDGAQIRSFWAFDPGFDNGLQVASGDIDGDGRADIIVAADAGAGPHVKVFSGATGAEIRSFFAFDAGFKGGVRGGSGDVNGDGRDDLIIGAGPGAGPHVKVFSGTDNSEIRSFWAFAPGFDNGLSVAGGDVNNDGRAEIVVGADAGAGPHVKVFASPSRANTTELASFYAFTSTFTGGVRVATADANGDGRVDVVAGMAQWGAQAKAFDITSYASPPVLGSYLAFSNYAGGMSLGGTGLSGSGAAPVGNWTRQGGDAGMTKYSSDTIAAAPLQQVYHKRFYSKWTNWSGSYGNYQPANNVMIRNGQSIVLTNDAADTAGDYGPLYTTQFDWLTGQTTWKGTIPSDPTNGPRWFHGGENPAEIDSHHFKFPAVWADDNRVYARRGGDQRAMGAFNVADHTWTYISADTPIPAGQWAGDAAAFINVYKDRLLYHPGDTRDGWNYASQDVSATAWASGTPGQSAVWLPIGSPRITGDQYNDGLRTGDIPKAAQDVAVIASWRNDTSTGTKKTYVTASNVYTGQQLWTHNYDSANVGGTGFYTGTSDYWQFLASEDGYYAMFNRPAGKPATVHMLDLQTGNEKWSKTLVGDASPLLAYHGGALYVIARNEQLKVNADTGAVVWRTTSSFPFDTCKVLDDPVYRPVVLTDDSIWFVNNYASGGDHLVGLRTSNGQVFQDLNLQTLVGASERELVVQDLVASDHRLGVFLGVKDLTDATHTTGTGQKYQDLFVFHT